MPDLLDLQNRHIRLKSPLTEVGAEALYFLTMTKTERLGRLFVMRLNCISNDHHIKLKDVLGKPMTIELDLPESSADVRYFHGLVTEFHYLGHFEGFAHYKAILRPWPWFLSRKQDSRIFQEKTVPEIIEQVFKEINKFDDFRRRLHGNYRKRVYCVQYRETDFNFVSRLMEEEGIYYYFEHEQDKHTLVLSDDYSSHGPFPGYEDLMYFPAEPDYRRKEDHIWKWNFGEEVQSGKVVLDDFDFVKPSTDLKAQSAGSGGYAQSDWEVFDYPGLYTEVRDGEGYARVRMEEHGALQEQCRGEGNARGLAVGHCFSLNEEAAPDWRDEQNREYLITSATHVLRLEESTEQEDSYEIRFTAIDSKVPFRPQRTTPKPTVRGIQTAIVCGPKGEEIWTDEYGRVKVHFHWDRYGKYDENSSCWIRVAQIWAGKNWGGMYMPRVGQEVVVDFLEGDPDRPLITGRVYNGSSMPPYSLPDNATMSTVKSNSSKGGGGFNEFRFEDKKGEEQIFLHAERTQHNRVKDSSFEWVGKDRHTIIVGSQYEQVDTDKHLTVAGDQNEKVDGTVSLTAGADLQQKVSMNSALEAGLDIYLKAGLGVVIEASVGITLKVGGSSIVLTPAAIFIAGGPLVNINSGAGPKGSGSASPEAAKPPEEAVTAEPGQVDEYAGAKVAQKRGSNPTAAGLQAAAASGAPFCEQCEALAAQSEG